MIDRQINSGSVIILVKLTDVNLFLYYLIDCIRSFQLRKLFKQLIQYFLQCVIFSYWPVNYFWMIELFLFGLFLSSFLRKPVLVDEPNQVPKQADWQCFRNSFVPRQYKSVFISVKLTWNPWTHYLKDLPWNNRIRTIN